MRLPAVRDAGFLLTGVDMARCKITQQWSDGTVTQLEVTVSESYPDAVDQARLEVVKLWREVCAEAEAEAPESDG